MIAGRLSLCQLDPLFFYKESDEAEQSIQLVLYALHCTISNSLKLNFAHNF